MKKCYIFVIQYYNSKRMAKKLYLFASLVSIIMAVATTACGKTSNTKRSMALNGIYLFARPYNLMTLRRV